MASEVDREAVRRFVSSVCAFGLAGVTGVVVARSLGPSGKGTVATVSYLTALVGTVASLGLGEASIMLHRRRAVPLATLRRPVLRPTWLAGLVGGVTVAVFAQAVVDSWSVALLGALGVPATALLINLTRMGEAVGRYSLGSFANVLAGAATVAMTILLVPMLDTGEVGAVGAALVGGAVGCLAMVLGLHGAASPGAEPNGNERLTRAALRTGLPLMLAAGVRTIGRRADVLLVYLLATPAAAGRYSLALTVGEIALYAPWAVTSIDFPRLAGTADGHADAVVARTVRISALVSLVSIAPLLAVTPLVVPLAFGTDFSGAIPSALLLVVASFPTALQVAMARACAALGRSRPLLRSHLVSTVVMVAADVILIPVAGEVGAATACIAGAVAGGFEARRGLLGVTGLRGLRWMVPNATDLDRLRRLVQRAPSDTEGEAAPIEPGP